MASASNDAGGRPEQFDCFVHGKPVPARSGKRFDVMDPGTEAVWASVSEADAEDVDGAVQSSHEAFQTHSRWTPRQRAQCLWRWHGLIGEARERLAGVLVAETGKPLAQARAEVDYGLGFLAWFAGEAERIQGSSVTAAAAGGRRAVTIKQPVGVAAALVPWNFPLALALRKTGAALAAGCVMVVKPSPETPVSALALARLAAGAVNVLPTSAEATPRVAEALCRHARVRQVSLTGSARAGRAVAGWCATHLKRSTLELGGNCPAVVFADVDVARVADQLADLKWRHAGQACVAANRIYAQRPVHDALAAALAERAARLRTGHGLDPASTLGPLTTARALARAEALARDALARGARLRLGTGARVPGRRGFFMEPTLLTGVTDMLMSRDEIFAPLAGLSVFDSEDEVVARANDTAMGLASYVFNKDVDRLWRMFEKLESGMVGLVRPSPFLLVLLFVFFSGFFFILPWPPYHPLTPLRLLFGASLPCPALSPLPSLGAGSGSFWRPAVLGEGGKPRA